MSKWSNTPGPWVLDGAYCPEHDTETLAILKFEPPLDKDTGKLPQGLFVITEIVEPGCKCGDEAIYNKEDGRLMAKSPELAEALEVLIGKWYEGTDPSEWGYVIERCERILEEAKNGVDNEI